MNIWIILGIVAVAGLALLVIYSLLAMAARSDRKALELAKQPQSPGSTGFQPADVNPLQPVPEGFTWCPNCQAMFKNKICPGCAPD